MSNEANGITGKLLTGVMLVVFIACISNEKKAVAQTNSTPPSNKVVNPSLAINPSALAILKYPKPSKKKIFNSDTELYANGGIITAETQSKREDIRARILKAELSEEILNMNNARMELANAESEEDANRIKHRIANHKGNVNSITAELKKVGTAVKLWKKA